MKKSGVQYADEVRILRASGFNFPASSGYKLASPAQWSSGQKAAVTRAFNASKRSRAAIKGAATRKRNQAAAAREATKQQRTTRGTGGGRSTQDFAAPDVGQGGLTESEGLEFFADGAGDANEEWDDIDFLDFDEGELFEDENDDQYAEDT